MTGRRSRTTGKRVLAAGVLAWAAAGCSLDSLLKNDEPPPGISDPARTQTPQGALAVYHGTVALFRNAFGDKGNFVSETGLLSDELRAEFDRLSIDERDLPELGSSVSQDFFKGAQKVRGQAGQAIGLLTRYSPEQRALIGHAYALEGYTEIMLAELFCSGIPLSTLDFDGDYTPRPGSTTADVFTYAAALFDTALTFVSGSDSTRFVHLAAVGKARALLGLDSTRLAAEVVAGVPDAYHYDVNYSSAANSQQLDNPRNFATTYLVPPGWEYTVVDQEGGNGLDYITSGDPRTAMTTFIYGNGQDIPIHTVYHPVKYAMDGSSPIVLASGVEARLIQAEAALQVGDASWLTTLNALRTDGTFDTQTNADDPTKTDTLWHAGSGGVDSLRPLADPSSADARVDLLFRERAFWLFLTGHRQGDLRRLIRQYHRAPDQIYPIGPYHGRGPEGFRIPLQYGSEVTVPIPSAEHLANPLFTGCISRQA